jgi:hypothetical protein
MLFYFKDHLIYGVIVQDSFTHYLMMDNWGKPNKHGQVGLMPISLNDKTHWIQKKFVIDYDNHFIDTYHEIKINLKNNKKDRENYLFHLQQQDCRRDFSWI